MATKACTSYDSPPMEGEEGRCAAKDEEGAPAVSPVQLFGSYPIPPAPSGSESSIDWLRDFAGLSWIAYAASSLLVISHFPSPISQEQTLLGPVFRQVIQPPCGGNGPDVIAAVAWCPSLPSDGELAAAFENRICLYSAESGSLSGSFCWKQTAGLVQSYTVQALGWTESGDALVAAGMEVLVWKKKNKFWEVAWKMKTEVPQTLVSTTWNFEGLVATAACAFHLPSDSASDLQSVSISQASTCVTVCHGDGKLGFIKLDLCHPKPVTMIQWRPSTIIPSKNCGMHSRRNVLLTCCLDGTVRLWCEIDNKRPKKPVKSAVDHTIAKRSFHVAAVIEMNQLLKGTLGVDIFIRWAIEFKDTIDSSHVLKECCSAEVSEMDSAGRCEWLIGVGPGSSLTLWTVHCLDEVYPLRFPRITLWKRLNTIDFSAGCSSISKRQPVFLQAFVSRKQSYSPPSLCSLLVLLPHNSIYWPLLYNPASTIAENTSLNVDNKDSYLSCFSSGILNQDGHTGQILQVAIHPYVCDVELAVSLDSDGMLLFWSLPTTNLILGPPSLFNPTWKLLGRISTCEISKCVKYSTLRWAYSGLNGKQLLLMGHKEGIDCFMTMISCIEGEKILYHKICTIPFPTHNDGVGPDHIYTMPLPDIYSQDFVSNSFILICIWMKDFLALSWRFVLHFEDSNGSGGACCYNVEHVASSKSQMYECTFDGFRCCIVASPCSSVLPDPHLHDVVTSVSVGCIDNWMPPSEQKWALNVLGGNGSMYQMVTGCSDGSIKLWRTCLLESFISHSEDAPIPWELVGFITTNLGPVNLISMSSCGSKIAAVSDSGSYGSNILHIWGSVNLVGVGNFFLEDTTLLNDAAIALNWLTVGNGQLLLGVCKRNELCVYARKRCNKQVLAGPSKFFDPHIWFCVAFGYAVPNIRGFICSPRSIPIIVHDTFFCLFSLCYISNDLNCQSSLYSKCNKESSSHCTSEICETMHFAVYSDGSACNIKSSPIERNVKESDLPYANINMKHVCGFCHFCQAISQAKYEFFSNDGFHSILERVDALCGPLPIFHPEAVLLYLCTGDWKRAYGAIKYLVACLGFDETSDANGKLNRLRSPCSAIPQIQLSQYIDGLSSKSSDKGLEWSNLSSEMSISDFGTCSVEAKEAKPVASFPGNVFRVTSGKSEIIHFREALEKSQDITAKMNIEKTQILAVVDILGEVCDSCYSSAYESFDDPGRRFWVATRFQQLYFLRKIGRLANVEELVNDSSSIVWAFHSDCHDDLFRLLLSNDPSWPEMRSLGVGYWFSNSAGLRTRMEKLARSQYLKRKDPKDCALLYLALNRLQVLAGLFKISKDEKDKPLVRFISRNFQDEKNKAAALKNAYVLMGQHKLELAIAFFILGGDFSSAVTVCAKNLGDDQLALVICRLIEGYGGPLECHLISTLLLPSAIEKGDNWLASMLEWALGNYSQSFTRLIGSRRDSPINGVVIPCNRVVLVDPCIGQYCALLTSKTSIKNCFGEYTAGILSRWAIGMTATSLNCLGFPLEALACLSSSSSVEGKDQISISDVEKLQNFYDILDSTPHFVNWLSGDVACHLEFNAKINLAMQHCSKLLMEHPTWPKTHFLSPSGICREVYEIAQYRQLLEEFESIFSAEVTLLEQKYSLDSVCLLNKILFFASNNGLLLLGRHVLHGYTSRKHLCNEKQNTDNFILNPHLLNLLWKAWEEASLLLVRYIIICCLTSCPVMQSIHAKDYFWENRPACIKSWDSCLGYIRNLMSLLMRHSSSFFPEGFSVKTSSALDLLEYCLYFALTWSQRKPEGLFLLIKPIMMASRDCPTLDSKVIIDLKKKSYESAEFQNALSRCEGNASFLISEEVQSETTVSLPNNEKWLLIGICLSQHLSNIFDGLLDGFTTDVGFDFSNVPVYGVSSQPLSGVGCDLGMICRLKPVLLFPMFLAKILRTTMAFVSSSLCRCFSLSIFQKVDRKFPVSILRLLEDSCTSQPMELQDILRRLDYLKEKSENEMPFFEVLWEISINLKTIFESVILQKLKSFSSVAHGISCNWDEICEGLRVEDEDTSIINLPGKSSTAIAETGSAPRNRPSDANNLMVARQKDPSHVKPVSTFHSPKEIIKKNGELIEAICVNSIDRHEGALASNRKGLVFFNLRLEDSLKEQAEYIWSEADWPRNGWAGSECRPVPTHVSPFGLGSKEEAYLGTDGAKYRRGALARPGRDLTGGGAFGIPGYAGVGASGFGWSEQDLEFVDPPATTQNISTRALSSHPSLPFFLVGSSNTHVYLWKFGEERATSTYGVLPVANVPPPYAIASISAVQFDCYGHRFATAALDGTISTWQMEVGGRSNVYPTQSSLPFNGYASDVAYVASSGSILAAAGYSSSGVNLVLWDTLAPPASSQASVVCHEGGARSLAVFDVGLGSGSTSPLIVTGGKGGDISLHDFRFIATGRTKRHRNFTGQNSKPLSNFESKSGISIKYGEQNRNGMLWHTAKAHQGCITRISTIPNTSLFLTGSKDGDVKLWDARRAEIELIYHWEKIHEKHTFLQPSSHGFGSVVRAAVTDIKVLPYGFLTCGGDGSVRLVQTKDARSRI